MTITIVMFEIKNLTPDFNTYPFKIYWIIKIFFKCKIYVIVAKIIVNLYLHFFSVNWCSKHDLPTPISPIMMYLKIYE